MGFRDSRIKAGIPASKVAEYLEVSDTAVYLWETGVTKPNAKRLLKLARLYGVTVDELLSGSDTDAKTS